MDLFLHRLDAVAGAAFLAAAAWRLRSRWVTAPGARRLALLGAGLALAAALAAGLLPVIDGDWTRDAAPRTVQLCAGVAAIGLLYLALGGLRAAAAPRSALHTAAVVVLGIGAAAGAATLWLHQPVPFSVAALVLGLALWLATPPPPAGTVRTLLRRVAGPVFAVLWVVGWVYLAVYVQLADAAARRLVAPYPRFPPTMTDAPERFGWERVHFTAADGVPLVGWWVPGRRPATVLFVHGHGDQKGTFVNQINWMHGMDWSAFVYDIRTHGESGGHVATLGVHEQLDLEAAITEVVTRQRRMPNGAGAPLVVFAYSLGGTIAIPTVARDQRVSGLLVEGTGPDPLQGIEEVASRSFGRAGLWLLPAVYRLVWLRTGAWVPDLDTRGAIARISPRPVVVVYGGHDTEPVAVGRQLYEAAGEPKRFLEATHSRHVAAFYDDFPTYSLTVLQFLAQFPPVQPAPAS